ncbi:hypothetical protein LTR09_008460 [Extremus antarcticus]|uniref:Uncharacterized protein n=1 Tax=Extremus antarcticus TaxID=702011 RepID=A0AAJ0DHL1_9PEZI|nr:hypothetical protein LTR09_008460 [Extremus antarcticus]
MPQRYGFSNEAFAEFYSCLTDLSTGTSTVEHPNTAALVAMISEFKDLVDQHHQFFKNVTAAAAKHRAQTDKQDQQYENVYQKFKVKEKSLNDTQAVQAAMEVVQDAKETSQNTVAASQKATASAQKATKIRQDARQVSQDDREAAQTATDDNQKAITAAQQATKVDQEAMQTAQDARESKLIARVTAVSFKEKTIDQTTDRVAQEKFKRLTNALFILSRPAVLASLAYVHQEMSRPYFHFPEVQKTAKAFVVALTDMSMILDGSRSETAGPVFNEDRGKAINIRGELPAGVQDKSAALLANLNFANNSYDSTATTHDDSNETTLRQPEDLHQLKQIAVHDTASISDRVSKRNLHAAGEPKRMPGQAE